MRRADPATAGIMTHEVSPVGVASAVIFDLVDCALRERSSGNLHVGDAAPLQDVVLDVPVVGLTGQLLNDSAENAVAEIRIGKDLARSGSERHAF